MGEFFYKYVVSNKTFGYRNLTVTLMKMVSWTATKINHSFEVWDDLLLM